MRGICAAVAGAQSVTITYTGAVSSTPAPQTWMLMGLGLLLAFFVFRKAHRLPGGRAGAAILMLVAVPASTRFPGHPFPPSGSGPPPHLPARGACPRPAQPSRRVLPRNAHPRRTPAPEARPRATVTVADLTRSAGVFADLDDPDVMSGAWS